MGTLKAAAAGFVAALVLVGTVAAAFVPVPVVTSEIAPDTYLRVVCEQPGAELRYIEGAEGEGFLICPRVTK